MHILDVSILLPHLPGFSIGGFALTNRVLNDGGQPPQVQPSSHSLRVVRSSNNQIYSKTCICVMVAEFSRCGDYCEGLAGQDPVLVWALHVSRWVCYHLEKGLTIYHIRKGLRYLALAMP